ncbi:hypothetical protein L249_1056 [Ophiocordyceps polyrhachis-furcata BCC 54312]|uniref:Uncharacterized protein n=1 Tax=Ophiocordyceps polyrhachis-furcata BCC 54312 TaxID=1330021 RepID=A0A367LC96_9HYPO|nr:hypothetical protein L249_1056 [Ophiocordyceps polyrhachis-furcata BCC 54312]
MLLKTKRPFRIIKRVGHLAYRLDLDKSLNIYPVTTPTEKDSQTTTIPTPKTLNYYLTTTICPRIPLPVAKRVNLRRLLWPYPPYCPRGEADLRRNFYSAYALLETHPSPSFYYICSYAYSSSKHS